MPKKPVTIEDLTCKICSVEHSRKGDMPRHMKTRYIRMPCFTVAQSKAVISQTSKNRMSKHIFERTHGGRTTVVLTATSSRSIQVRSRIIEGGNMGSYRN
ncbi:zinc finger protein pegasus [Moniliophthora roreri]|nr:zinc finger protein pegasus [Moniliophthora roreri]